ncbi:MAG: hypothetical protein ABIO63_02195 [Casimicrobiaceae bacterium]
MSDQITYRVRVVFVGKGMERTLPYEIEEQDAANDVASSLNLALENNGYHHYVIPVVENITPSKKRKANA